MNFRQRQDLDRHITGNYGEDSVDNSAGEHRQFTASRWGQTVDLWLYAAPEGKTFVIVQQEYRDQEFDLDLTPAEARELAAMLMTIADEAESK